jgi:hypothetical protein
MPEPFVPPPLVEPPPFDPPELLDDAPPELVPPGAPHVMKLNVAFVTPPSSVVTATFPPPPPAVPQVPPPEQAIPDWLSGHQVPPVTSQMAHARLTPVGVGPLPPLELLLEPEPSIPTPASSTVGAQPFGSSQHVAGMQVLSPEQSWPMFASEHSVSGAVVRTHWLPVQIASAEQATPHPPQCALSLVVSTQMPEHAVRPGSQVPLLNVGSPRPPWVVPVPCPRGTTWPVHAKSASGTDAIENPMPIERSLMVRCLRTVDAPTREH